MATLAKKAMGPLSLGPAK